MCIDSDIKNLDSLIESANQYRVALMTAQHSLVDNCEVNIAITNLVNTHLDFSKSITKYLHGGNSNLGVNYND